MNKNLCRSLIVLAAVVGLAGCQRTSQSPDSSISQNASKAVHLAIWSNYVTPQMLEEFQKQTGFKVDVSNYSSNEELLAKLQAGAAGIDVAVPSDYMVATMAELGVLESVKLDQVPHFQEISENLKKPYYDANNQFSVPFAWGTTGIAINTKVFKGDVSSWKQLFESPELAGKFTLLDDVRETLGAALKSQGYSLNSVNAEEIQKARDVLMKARENVRAFSSETLAGLMSGDYPVSHAYSIDGLQAAAQTGGAVKYVIPQEGCTHWVDNLVIPKGAKNIAGAHALINFLISKEVGAERAKAKFVAPSNAKSLELLPADVRSNTNLFPTADTLAKCEMLRDLGDGLAAWDRSWTEVRASR